MRGKRGEEIEQAEDARWRRATAAIVGVSLLSHIAYDIAGIRFDSSGLGYFWQYLDPMLLDHRLAQSLFYLHSQPPLFNLFLGLVLKASPGDPSAVFHFIYAALGLCLSLSLLWLFRRLGVSLALALAMTIWFIVSPAFTLYEHWLFYTFPLTAILTLSALALHGLASEGRRWQATVFFGLLFLLCTTMSLFHLIFYICIAGVVVALVTRARRTILITAVIPAILLGGLYLKNMLVFGQFTASTWLGMNLAGTTLAALPPAVGADMVAKGQLSQLSLIGRFSDLEKYPERNREVRGFERIPCLREEWKSTGAPNYNHLAYIGISRQYLRDSLALVRIRPVTLVSGLANSWLAYFESATHYPFLAGNRGKIEALDELWNRLFYGKLSTTLVLVYPPANHELFIGLLIGFPLLLVIGLRQLFRNRTDAPRCVVLIYICAIIIYTAFIGNIFEAGENQRFRFMTDPLYLLLAGLCLEKLRTRVTARVKQESKGQSRAGRARPKGRGRDA